DTPQRGTALTPTCDPRLLAITNPITGLVTANQANPANTYFNQLGCAISRLTGGTPVANTPETATTFLLTAGIKGGVFSVPLNNFPVQVIGGEAGKTAGSGFTYYATIPDGQRLDTAAISPDGQFLFGGSSRTNDTVWACLNPLGDPGDPAQPLPSMADFA